MEMMLESLVGPHELSGVDFGRDCFNNPGAVDIGCECIHFILDGITYSAIEARTDGYRSCLDRVFVNEAKVKNVFAPIKVMGLWNDRTPCTHCYELNEILELRDVVTAKVVLEVGTANTNEYYPYFVGRFIPESMVVNL